MAKRNKLTWEMIYQDFKKMHPRSAKTVMGFQPYNYATILLIFPNRVRKTYNYDTKEVTILRKRDTDKISKKGSGFN